MIEKYIKRHYTKELDNNNKKSVYDLFSWKEVEVVLKDYATQKVLTDMQKLEFPEHYSQSACDIIASKYFRKRGVLGERDYEYSMKQIVHRMVDFWISSMLDSGLITKEQSEIVYDELAYTMLAQMWAPNSPQWFNTGLSFYGIKGEAGGHYYFDIKKNKVVESKDGYTRTQGSACFITSVEDSLMGPKSLTDQITTETLLFKYGSGVGSNWSSIRAKGERLSGGGKSSGLLSFLKVSDRNAGAIKSGGTTRRAAKMNVLNLDHPEILDYIEWKSKEEDKAYALGKMGYSLGFDDEAYDTVSGQNANNSVRITNEYMKKLGMGAKWKIKGRVDESVNREIDADLIWNKIAEAAWRCGDPGVQYDDIINDWHTCPVGEDGQFGAFHNRINASNPCSEYMFLDDTACNLSSINLMKFYDTQTGKFDYEGYKHNIFLNQLILESTIHFGQFPTPDIARKSHLFRTTGLGYTNLGTLILSMGIPYDSDEARAIAASLASLMTGYSYFTSSLMAEKLGTFSKYEINKSHMLRVIHNHAACANYDKNKKIDLNYKPVVINHELLERIGMATMTENLKQAWNLSLEHGEKHGFRNAQVTVLAPTGTIAFAMDCQTTSSEPFFSHVVFKKLVGGGFMEIVNNTIGSALKKLGYQETQIKEIEEYIMRKKDGMIVDGKIEGAPHLKLEHYPIFDTANKCGTGERFISANGHVKMMASISPHITGALSKTVNLPKSATIEDIKEIYRLSWELGIKAIALYRDGCKASQPLNTTIYAEEQKLED
ncbi:MAG: vitamin B12-dependent ribonucleotide reductase, partial [Defluviitaleaceae bacterium]|nr:vitamin B12-dependent ribonucleotide reductase [Defluviitaleaceae bacterium]